MKVKRFLLLIIFSLAFAVIAFKYLLPSDLKLDLFTFFYKRYVRILSRSNPSVFLDKKILDHKLSHPVPLWMQQQIATDLMPFKNGIDTHKFKELLHLHMNGHQNRDGSFHENRLVIFKITQGHVTADTTDNVKTLRSFKIMLDVFKFIGEQGYVDNIEFILCLQDYFSSVDNKIVPILSFAKDLTNPGENTTILIPDWMNLRGWILLKPRIDYANKLYPWHKKQAVMFWRGGGADSSGYRTKLVEYSKMLPTIIDAKWSEGPEAAKFLQPEHHIKYKYQISIDGSRCTWERVVWQLFSNCLMLKQVSAHKQWFYNGLAPYENYIPITDYSKDAIEQLYSWLEANQEMAQTIINNANNFARNNLETEDLFYYLITLLREYQKLQKPS